MTTKGFHGATSEFLMRVRGGPLLNCFHNPFWNGLHQERLPNREVFTKKRTHGHLSTQAWSLRIKGLGFNAVILLFEDKFSVTDDASEEQLPSSFVMYPDVHGKPELIPSR